MHPGDSARISESIVARAKALGFALAGVTPAALSDHQQAYRDWIEAGKQGEMHYLEEHAEQRLDPDVMLPGVKSIILVADQYAARNDPPDQSDERALAHNRGKVARYARGRDYHKVIKKRLHTLCDELIEQFPGETFRAFVDTAPVLEREHAARAGLGWIGKHSLLIHHRRGSYLFLGGILTTKSLTPPRTQRTHPDYCGTCTRCIDACPTYAITPYSVDATRCISYLTIEHRSTIDPEFFKAIGPWIYGCDICQEVCPHNSKRTKLPVGRRNEAYDEQRTDFDLLEVLGWTEDDRRAAFQGSAMKRASLPMMRRNALIARANAAHSTQSLAELHTDLRRTASDDEEHPLVRETARQLLERA